MTQLKQTYLCPIDNAIIMVSLTHIDWMITIYPVDSTIQLMNNWSQHIHSVKVNTNSVVTGM